MVAQASISAIGYFMPIFAFLLVFIVVYALLKKTEVLGTAEPIMLFISFILAGFFIVEASLVEFVQLGSAWFSVLVVLIFFILLSLYSYFSQAKLEGFFNNSIKPKLKCA